MQGTYVPAIRQPCYQSPECHLLEHAALPQDQSNYQGWKRCSILPFVNGLRRIKSECYLQIMNRKPGSFSQIHNISAGHCQVNRWEVHLTKHLLFPNYCLPSRAWKSRLSLTQDKRLNNSERLFHDGPILQGQQGHHPILFFCSSWKGRASL